MKNADEPFEKQDAGDDTKNRGNEKLNSDTIKNAHASGMGSLERSDENQIEKLNKRNRENEETNY